MKRSWVGCRHRRVSNIRLTDLDEATTVGSRPWKNVPGLASAAGNEFEVITHHFQEAGGGDAKLAIIFLNSGINLMSRRHDRWLWSWRLERFKGEKRLYGSPQIWAIYCEKHLPLYPLFSGRPFPLPLLPLALDSDATRWRPHSDTSWATVLH